MRKVLAMLMALGILFSLCACGVRDDARNTENSSAAVGDTTESVTTEKTVETTTETTRTHTFRAATCTAPKTCSCGATEGNPLDVPGKENYHGHVYTGGSSSKKYHYEANCAGKNSHEITWEEVERRGLGPCGTCVLK